MAESDPAARTAPHGAAPEGAATPTILDRTSPADVRTDPFPHLVLDDALPADLYRTLADTFPSVEQMVGTGVRVQSNQRFPFSACMVEWAPWIDAAWKRLVAAHTSRDFLRRVRSLFDGHWTDAADAVWAGLDDASLGLFMRDEADIVCDARLEINTPVTERPSSVRGGHLDTPNRLFSALFYIRPPEDDTEGGDLALYRFRGGRVPDGPLDVFAFPDAQLEEVARVPYAANRLVIFPNRTTALHGVTPRPVTPWTRRYVFVTAEVKRELF